MRIFFYYIMYNILKLKLNISMKFRCVDIHGYRRGTLSAFGF